MVRSGRSTSGMSWLNAIAAGQPDGAGDGQDGPAARGQRRAASTKPNAPAATSSTVNVGCSRNDNSVVRASVVSIDTSDHR